MVFYFVQRGETLYAIAKRYQTTVHAIVAANRLEDPNAICAGQALIIPRPGEVPSPPPGGIVHLVRPGETIFYLAEKFGSTPHDILRANQIAHPEFIIPGQQLVIPERLEVGAEWPMLGRTAGRVSAGPAVLEGKPIVGWTYAARKSIGVRPSAPIIRYDRVYVGLSDGYYYALDRQSGRVKWRIPAITAEMLGDIGEQPLPAPAVFDGLVYICLPDGMVHAIDAYSGQPIWKVNTESAIAAAPLVYEGVLYFGSLSGQVFALEAKTGAIAWRVALDGPVRLPAAAGDNQLYVVSDRKSVWALDIHTGKTTWKASTPATRQPIFAEVMLLVGGVAYDTKNGSQHWQITVGAADPVVILDQVIYPGGAVDLFTGAIRWAHQPGVHSSSARPEEVEAKVPAVTQEESFVTVPEYEVPVLAQIASGSQLLSLGDDRRLYMRESQTGFLIWSLDLQMETEQPPATAPGQCVIVSREGVVRSYRFKAKPIAD
jgi:outer membrane protein assembly factor BamB